MDKEMFVLRLMDMLDGAARMSAQERETRAREYVYDLLEAHEDDRGCNEDDD